MRYLVVIILLICTGCVAVPYRGYDYDYYYYPSTPYYYYSPYPYYWYGPYYYPHYYFNYWSFGRHRGYGFGFR